MKPEFDSDEDEYSHRFEFFPIFDYAPEAQILVYCIRDERIVSTKLSVELYDDFNNFIDLNATQEMIKPGEMVDIQVKSNPNSYIGLLGVDQSVLLLRDGNDLSRNEIWNQLKSFHQNKKSFENVGQRALVSPWKDFSVNFFFIFFIYSYLFTNLCFICYL